jgi:phosphoribosylformimino-5-aminoimidazole carboxamide ribotide isomerase
MNIYPAIDIKSGACVRLFKGAYDQVTIYGSDPVAMAQSFAREGATHLHIVDLDSAIQGGAINLAVVREIANKTQLTIQMGGGIRTQQQLNHLFDFGIHRVILGSMAIKEPDEVKQWLKKYGTERIALSLDVRMNQKGLPILMCHGWQRETNLSLWQFMHAYHDQLLHVICTDVQRDGTLTGPNMALYKTFVTKYPAIQLQAAGGIRALSDLAELARIPIAGAIVGKALYEHQFSLSSAIHQVSVC